MMDNTISARTVNAVLYTVRDISGPQYEHLLERTGWQRFREAIPESSAEMVATRDELEKLFTNVYMLLGEELTRLFLRNYGRLLVLHMPAKEMLRIAAVTISPQEQMRWFVGEIAQISTRSWTPVTVSEDFHAYYLTFERCPLCTGIRSAHAPICSTMEALYSHLAQHVLRRRLRIAEIECAATGAPRCKIAIYKDHTSA